MGCGCSVVGLQVKPEAPVDSVVSSFYDEKGPEQDCEDPQVAKSRAVDKYLSHEKMQDMQKVKLLLLGPGSSGKSTLLKQFRILYGASFTYQELKIYSDVIHSNIRLAVLVLCKHCESFGYKTQFTAQELAIYNEMAQLEDGGDIDEEMGKKIAQFWASKAIQKTWNRRNETPIVETHKVFLDDIDRISSKNWIATEQDLLHCRVRTSGIVEQTYHVDGTTFQIVDVGGQRTERKKWMHCFQGVDAIIYIVALNEFDKAMYENTSKNRMEDAIEVFREICANKLLRQVALIVFLNKRDLFQEKIQGTNIGSIPQFSDFPGGIGDFELGFKYFLQKFLNANENPKRAVYPHITCATDTQNVVFVWQSCKDSILRKNLHRIGYA